MKKIVAGVLAIMTIGCTSAFACGGHGGCGRYNRWYSSNRNYCYQYVDANHDGVCDNYGYHCHSGSYRGCHW